MTLASTVRRATRAGAATTVLLLTGLGPVAAPAADAAAASAAPLGQYADTLTFSIDSITPVLVTATDSVITITGTMTNTADEALRSVSGRIQRGAVLDSPAELAAEIDDPSQPAAAWTDFAPLVAEIPAQGTAPFSISAAAFGPDDSLGITAPGVYPVMLNVNAEFDSGPESGARVGELHALATVTAVPVADEASPPAEQPTSTGTAQPLNVLIPLVDRPHRDPTGAFFDDDLAPLISPGGRLDSALRAAETTMLPDSAITVAVDPELIEELELMEDGYFVGPFAIDLPTAAAAATTTATADPSAGAGGGDTQPPQPLPGPDAVPGTGSDAAAAFLARLRTLARTVSVLVLPYSDADTVAMVRNGQRDDVGVAVTTGQELAASALGPGARLVTDVAWPIDGQVDEATLTALRESGLTSAVLAATGVGDASVPVATVDTAAGPVTGVIANGDLPSGALALNTFTAVTAQNYFGEVSRPAVYAGTRTRTATENYPELVAVLAALNKAGMVTGSGLRTMTGAGATTTLDYSEAAQAAELSPGVFASIAAETAAVASLQSAFTAPASTPGQVGGTGSVAPDDMFATMIDGMRRLVAGGFRSAPVAAAIAGAAVPSTIGEVQQAVAIVPPSGSYTLTSTSSPLLVVVRNDLAYDVHLRVRVNPLDTARAGITIEDVGLTTVPAGRSVTVQIPAEINRAGFFTVRVQLTTDDGALWGAEQPLQMRSTAYGAFTITLIVVAAVIVVITSALRIRKRWKDRRARIAAGLQ